MKPLIDALTKLLEKLFSAKMIWFIVVVVALLASLLLWYGNASLPLLTWGCEGRPGSPTPTAAATPMPAAAATPVPTATATPTAGTIPTATSTPTAQDGLGLCDFINGPGGQKQWIGLIALAAIIMIGIKVVTWVVQGLTWVFKWLRDKLFVPPTSGPPA
jgi:hypothetical protein